MKHLYNISLLVFLITSVVLSQTITWTDVTATNNLPAGVKLIRGNRTSPVLTCWYLDIDMNRTDLAIKPYLNPIGSEGITPFSNRYGVIAAVNGGFFGSNVSYSAVVQPGKVAAKNIAAVTRQSLYYVTRGFFGITDDRTMSIDWIFHFGDGIPDIYKYAAPTNNTTTTPAPYPVAANGIPYSELIAGIGGAPVLVKNGAINITYDQEVMFGSGVGLDNADPRTAIGYTANKHIILMVADGRQTASDGFSLPELASVMKNLGCVEALNLDGGGSTQMWAGGNVINYPVGSTYQRPIVSMFAVVKADSMPFLPPTYYVKKMVTSDSNCTISDASWFQSANPGYYGNSKALLNGVGAGDKFVKFKVPVTLEGRYAVYGWWVASSNRSSTTPFIVKHKLGIDTVRVDQTVNGSMWKLIGNYTFAPGSSTEVTITNGTNTGNYVCANAIRVLSFDTTVMAIDGEIEQSSKPSDFKLYDSYPNPYRKIDGVSNSIKIEYDLAGNGETELEIFNVIGTKVCSIESGYKMAGHHSTDFYPNMYGIPSGIYFYKLASGGKFLVKKLVYLK